MTFFMLILLMSVVPLNGLALWAFVHFRPARGGRSVTIFDTAVFVVVPILCALFSFWVHARLNGQIENNWLPFFAALAWPSAFPVLLTIAGALRKLIFLRSQGA